MYNGRCRSISESVRWDTGPISTWKVFFLIENIVITKNLTNFCFFFFFNYSYYEKICGTMQHVSMQCNLFSFLLTFANHNCKCSSCPNSPYNVLFVPFYPLVQTRHIQISKSVSVEAVKYLVTASLNFTEYSKLKCSFDELI